MLGPHTRIPAPTASGQRTPAICPQDGQREEGERLTPEAPHNGERYHPRGQSSPNPAARDTTQGTRAKGPVPGVHTRTPAPTASAQRTLTACPRDCQLGENERLTLDAPHNGARHPCLGRPPATPTARTASSQERTLWGRCCIPTLTPPAPSKHGQQGPATRPKHRQPEEGERLTPDAPHTGERFPPRRNFPPPPRRATPCRTRTPQGQCRVPTPAHPRPQHVQNGPRLPGPRTGSRGRMST